MIPVRFVNLDDVKALHGMAIQRATALLTGSLPKRSGNLPRGTAGRTTFIHGEINWPASVQ